MHMEKDLLFVIRIEASRELGELFEAGLSELDDALTAWVDETDDHARLERFCESRTEAEALFRQFEPLLRQWAQDRSWTATIQALPRENWAESWKKFFHVQRISARIVIKPSWEPFAPAIGDCVIEIDPGLSFGTGQHATTRACLMLLDRLAYLAPEATVLDVGCGSGVLAIAAAKLGFRSVVGFDSDPVAVRIARENSVHNGVAAQIDFLETHLADWSTLRPYAIVMANLLAPLLIEHADRLTATVRRPQGHLLLAGILTTQYAGVRDAYLARGFTERESVIRHEWQTGWLVAGEGDPA
jgi:ribosomal protein L11 methyltransferase